MATYKHVEKSSTPAMKQDQCKKRSESRKHCALAVVNRIEKYSPRRRPPSRGRGTDKI